jgi:hypothetical protein
MRAGQRGRIKPSQPSRLAALRDRQLAPLPDPPALVPGFTYGATDFPMAGNDVWGDCTIAAVVHIDAITKARLGKPWTYVGDDAVVEAYQQLGGGSTAPGNGLDMSVVIADWSNPSGTIPSLLHTQLAYAATIDTGDHELARQVMWNFGFTYDGVDLMEAADQQFEDPPVTPGVWYWENDQPYGGGHCICRNGAEMLRDFPVFPLVTWGAQWGATYRCWDYIVDEVYAVIPTDYVEADHDALQALDQAALAADIAALHAAS